MISHRHLNHAAYLAYAPSVQHQIGGGGGRVHPVTGEYRGLEPKRIVRGNPLPHFPVQGISQLRTKTSHLFIYSSSDYNRRALNELTNSDLFVPDIGQAGGLSVEMRDT